MSDESFEPYELVTPSEYIQSAQTWDRQCRKYRDEKSILPESLYPATRRVAFIYRRMAREQLAGGVS